MKICFVVPHYQADIDQMPVETYLSRRPIHRDLPCALAARGHEVSVVHLAPFDRQFDEHGVAYRFISTGAATRTFGRAVGALRKREAALYEPAYRLARVMRRLNPDLIHVHGATLNLNVFLILRLLATNDPAIVLQYHGGYPATRALGRALQRRNFALADRLLFTTRAHAKPFEAAGVLGQPDRVVEFMETSSSFRCGARDEARRRTGMRGDPVCLWVGRLHPIKDPLTALRGFERVLLNRPGANLYLYYLTDELIDALRAYVAARPALRAHVHFRGRVPFEMMEDIYNSSDLLLQASLREFSGCAILEAMSCGVIPVITDIPSFRAMTAGGRVGKVFPIGDDAALAEAISAISAGEIPALSRAVWEHFNRAHSFPALAGQLEQIYGEVLGCKMSPV